MEIAAEVINRFRVINGKMTPREAIRGKHVMRIMPEFGENMLWLPEAWEGGRLGKLEPKSEKGIWLGVCPRISEAIVGTPAGVVRAGTVKRQAIEDAWKASSLLSISTTPWTTGRQSKRHELTVENDEEEKIVKVDESELPGDPRGLRITKEDIERLGFSDGCVGCNAMRQGNIAQRHSEYCSRRVQGDTRNTEEAERGWTKPRSDAMKHLSEQAKEWIA